MVDTLQSLTTKIDDMTKDSPIFFVTNDAERAFGVEKLFTNYNILCIDDNEIVTFMIKDKLKAFCLEKELGKLNIIYRNSNRLLKHKKTQEFINKITGDKKGYLMVFKIAPNIERTAENMGFKLLNTTSILNRTFELKLSQYKNLKDLRIRLPKTKILKLSSCDFKKLTNVLGERFFLQFNRGHTGGGTIIINSKHELQDLAKRFPQREVRLSKHIHGDPFTINACVTKHGICWGGLSFQLTGIEECTSQKNGTVGNDWLYPSKLSRESFEEIDKFTKVIGKAMQSYGFSGMFGIDFILETRTNKIYVIEVNARQPASIPLFSKLQIKNNQIPLNMLAIAEFLGIDYKIDVEKYNKIASTPIKASQIFIRNKFQKKAKLIGAVKPGVYRLVGDNSAYKWDKGKPQLKPNVIFLDEAGEHPLVYKEEAYAIDGIKEGGMLILCAKEGKIINSNNEVARIQIEQTLLDKNGRLKFWVKEVLQGLNKYVILRETLDD